MELTWASLMWVMTSPLLEPAGPGGRGQSLVGGDVGQPHHQDALGKT